MTILLNDADAIRSRYVDLGHDDAAICKAARISFDNLDYASTPERDARLVNYLIKNLHWSPVAHPQLLFTAAANEKTLLRVASRYSAGLRVEIIRPNLSDGSMIAVGVSVYWALKHWTIMPDTVRQAVIDAFPAAVAAANVSLYAPSIRAFAMADVIDIKGGPDSVYDALRSRGMEDEYSLSRMVTASLINKAPIWMARQLVKHQVELVWNEVSRRYVSDGLEYHLPDVLYKRAADKKQGSSDEPASTNARTAVLSSLVNEDEVYDLLIDETTGYGVAPEDARGILPLNTITNWVWTGSFNALARVYQLRSHEGTQRATRRFAEQLDATLAEAAPAAWSRARQLEGLV